MKVILLKDVKKIGKKHDVAEVSDGYASNFLFPQKLAHMATDSAIKQVEKLKVQSDADKAIQEDLLIKNLDAINNISIIIEEKVNEKGHLFASLHKERIVEEVKKQSHIDILPEYIDLEKPIKEAGDHEIHVHVKDHKATFKLTITAIEE